MANLNAIGRAVRTGFQPKIERQGRLTYLKELGDQQIEEETFRKKLRLKQMIDLLTTQGQMDTGQASLLAAAREANIDPKWFGIEEPMSAAEETQFKWAEAEEGRRVAAEGRREAEFGMEKEMHGLRKETEMARAGNYRRDLNNLEKTRAITRAKDLGALMDQNLPGNYLNEKTGELEPWSGNPETVMVAAKELIPLYESLGWNTDIVQQKINKMKEYLAATPLYEPTEVPTSEKLKPGKQPTEKYNDIVDLEKIARQGNPRAIMDLLAIAEKEGKGSELGNVAYEILADIRARNPEYFK